VLLAFKPVEEIDSINYLHYLLDWMANRATPYTFATNYVAFWELSFLPTWTVTRVDLFFPLLALKSVVLLALSGWLLGRELGLRRGLLAWTVFGGVMMRHFWIEPSGVPTLKNDALHGAGFVLMALVVMRAARRRLRTTDAALLALGVAFGAVKYTGIFVAVMAVVVVVAVRGLGKPKIWPAAAAVFLLTSGHFYLHNLLRWGSPFYPFQINLGFIHLPGTADLSYSSILYNLGDARLWRALFWPAGGVSTAGLLFPLVLAAILPLTLWRCLRAAWMWLHRTRPSPSAWAAFLILAGWMLYFRSVFSACAAPGDLSFILNSLNSVRYVDGVLLASELFLVARLARFGWPVGLLVAINLASRLAILYARLPRETFPLVVMCAASALAFALLALVPPRWRVGAAVAALVLGGPFLVERNRVHWTTYWNDLKPELAQVRNAGLAELAAPEGGYFAGHVVAAGNPVNPAVRSLAPEELDGMAAAERPRYLAVLVAPGTEASSDWRSRYGPRFVRWRYRMVSEGKLGAVFQRDGQ